MGNMTLIIKNGKIAENNWAATARSTLDAQRACQSRNYYKLSDVD